MNQDFSIVEMNNVAQSRRRSSKRSIGGCDSTNIGSIEGAEDSIIDMDADTKQTQRASIASEMIITEESLSDEDGCVDWDELDDESYSYS